MCRDHVRGVKGPTIRSVFFLKGRLGKAKATEGEFHRKNSISTKQANINDPERGSKRNWREGDKHWKGGCGLPVGEGPYFLTLVPSGFH